MCCKEEELMSKLIMFFYGRLKLTNIVTSFGKAKNIYGNTKVCSYTLSQRLRIF